MTIHYPSFPCFQLAVAALAAALIGASVRAEVTATATGRATLSSGTTFRDTDGVDETGLGIDQSGQFADAAAVSRTEGDFSYAASVNATLSDFTIETMAQLSGDGTGSNTRSLGEVYLVLRTGKFMVGDAVAQGRFSITIEVQSVMNSGRKNDVWVSAEVQELTRRYSAGEFAHYRHTSSEGDEEVELRIDHGSATDVGSAASHTFQLSEVPFTLPPTYAVSEVVLTIRAWAESRMSSKSGTSQSSVTVAIRDFSLELEGATNDIRWTNTAGGLWAEAGNWDPARVPGPGDTARIDAPGNYTVNLGTNTVDRLIVGGDILSDISLAGVILNAGTTSETDPSVTFNEGTIELSGLALLESNHAVIGPSTKTDVILAGVTLWENHGRLVVGAGGESLLSLFGNGTVLFTGEGRIGAASNGAAAAVTVNDRAHWDSGNLAVGYSGPGLLEVHANGEVNAGDAVIGVLEGAAGKITIKGAEGATARFNASQDIVLGQDGAGEMHVLEYGSTSIDGWLIVGDGAGDGNLVVRPNGTRGEVSVGMGTVVGDLSSGEITIEQAGRMAVGPEGESSAPLVVGREAAGSVTVTGEAESMRSSLAVNGVLTVGEHADGSLTIGDGAEVLADEIVVGKEEGFGRVTVSGGQTAANPSFLFSKQVMVVGGDAGFDSAQGGGGEVRIENGGVMSGESNLVIGGTRPGSVVVTGRDGAGRASKLINLAETYFGAANAGNLHVEAGGEALLFGDVQVGFLSEQPCEIVVTGDAPARSSMTCGNLNVGGARGPGIIRIENGAVLFAQYSLKLDERGTVDATTGRVAIGTTDALPEIGKVVVHSGGEISGVGQITAGEVVNAGGTIAPGASPGTLTVNGNFTAEPGSILLIEVAGTRMDADHDRLVVTGDVDFRGTVIVKFTDGFAPVAGTELTFIEAGGDAALDIEAIHIANVEAGFEHAIEMADGRTTFKALTDAVYLPSPTTRLRPLLNGEGQFEIRFEGGALGDRFVIERSTDLEEWLRVGEVTLMGANSRFQDLMPRESRPAVFYRVGNR